MSVIAKCKCGVVLDSEKIMEGRTFVEGMGIIIDHMSHGGLAYYTDWIITIPKTIPWEDYVEEIRACERDPDMEMNYRVPGKPSAKLGERCFIVWDGQIRGYMFISGIEYYEDGFECETTGTEWPPGWYIKRKGLFYEIEPLPMRGFQGIRRMKEDTRIQVITKKRK